MLTVGVPVYNAERFLERCLRVLCEESFDYRIMISDNASDDATEQIARSFAKRDPRIQYHRHEKNLGALGNFTYALESADTEFFAWRAYDDLSTPGYFQKLTEALEQNPDRALAIGGTRFIDSDGNPPADIVLPSELPQDPVARRKLLLKMTSPEWIYGVFRREMLAKRFLHVTGSFPYTWSFDTLVLLPYSLGASVQTVPDVSFVQYLSGQSATNYRPKGVIAPAKMVTSFCKIGFGFADELAGSLPERLALYGDVVRYADGRSEKFRRIAKRAAFWPYYKVSGRL